MNRVIITIDGPAASGKGSLCKLVSKDLNFYYLETGLYYRAFAHLISIEGKSKLDISSFIQHEEFKKYLKDTKNLYSKEVTNAASKLAKLEYVRKFIVDMQKLSINNFDKKFNGIILEGRDCGTVIAPEADIKIFLTADIEVRAKRRFEQFNKNKKNIEYEEVFQDLNKRDIRDKNRKHSPLKKADDAMLLDNSSLSFEQTIKIVKNIIFSRIPSLKNKIKI